MELYTQMAVNGLQTAALYALLAVGLTLVFGVMRIVNFAHAEFYMIGAYVSLVTVREGGSYLLSILLAAAIVGLLGTVVERTVFRRLRDNQLMGLVASIGLVLIFQIVIQQSFGSHHHAISMAFPQQIEFLGAVFVVHKLFIIGMALLLLGALSAFLNRTKTGLAVVATAQDADAAALQGMNPDSAARLTMGISTALAGMAGAIIAPTTIISPHMGVTVILPAFVVVIVGGAGSVRGALVASLLFGMLQGGATTLLSPTAAIAIGLGAMLIILSFRPEGIFAG